jgi:hypothetical protein
MAAETSPTTDCRYGIAQVCRIWDVPRSSFYADRRLAGLARLVRSSPSTPSSANRCCQRQTIGRLTPTRAAIGCTGPPPTEARMTRVRSTCLRCRLRSDVIASSRFLSDALTITHTVRAMAAEIARRQPNVNRQNASEH